MFETFGIGAGSGAEQKVPVPVPVPFGFNTFGANAYFSTGTLAAGAYFGTGTGNSEFDRKWVVWLRRGGDDPDSRELKGL